MAITIVKDITDAAESLIGATLLDFSELDYKHDILKNNFNNKTKRYGVLSLDGDFPDGRAMKNVTVDHTFQMILTTDYLNKDDDTAQVAAKNLLWENTHDMLKELINKKLGIPASVLLVSGRELLAPEFPEDDKCVVIIRTDFNVMYRYTTF